MLIHSSSVGKAREIAIEWIYLNCKNSLHHLFDRVGHRLVMSFREANDFYSGQNRRNEYINWRYLFYFNPDFEFSLMQMHKFGRPDPQIADSISWIFKIKPNIADIKFILAGYLQKRNMWLK